MLGPTTRVYRVRKPYKAAKNSRLVETAVDGEGTVYLTTYYDTPTDEPAAPLRPRRRRGHDPGGRHRR
ncbi:MULTISPECIES: hypothetical protein [Thermomonosporaceae]|uniref:hypothetical protein n=1 Tax=Thermomonosporaceae TaxID=2012 RepID=UPI00255A7D56|nr:MULTISPECIES: hypothetical protein [Thermomonosporaceae]MDL4772960.1 hypothetical protein [Actinomadura xylanilytica]